MHGQHCIPYQVPPSPAQSPKDDNAETLLVSLLHPLPCNHIQWKLFDAMVRAGAEQLIRYIFPVGLKVGTDEWAV